MSQDFDAFCRSEYPTIYRAAVAFTGNRDAAFDATQEAFSRAFARWGRLSSEPWVRGWVMTTALNLCRRRSSRDVIAEELRADRTETNDPDLHLDFEVALRALPLRQRQALLLHYFADLPVAAVADLMGASEGTVKTHLSRGRKTLARALAPSEGEVGL